MTKAGSPSHSADTSSTENRSDEARRVDLIDELPSGEHVARRVEMRAGVLLERDATGVRQVVALDEGLPFDRERRAAGPDTRVRPERLSQIDDALLEVA